MLGRNAKESWAYLLTLMLSTSLLFVFVNLQSDANFLLQLSYIRDPSLLIQNYSIIASLILIIAIICGINSFVANSYYVKAKSQELSVYLTCGMNIVVLSKYLVFQNLILLGGALVGGALIGVVFNVLLNIAMNLFIGLDGAIFTVSIQGFLMWGLILFFEVIYFVLLNVGYAYRAELKDLVDENRKNIMSDTRLFSTPVILYYVVYLASLIALWLIPCDVSYIAVVAGISLVGMQGMFTYALPKRFHKKMRKHQGLSVQKMVLRGNLLMLIKSCYLFVIMIFATFIGLVAMMPMGNSLAYTGFILCVAYFLIMVVMSISIFFKIMIEAKKRKVEFDHLVLLGLNQESILTCIKKEMVTLFSCILLFPLPCVILIIMRYVMAAQMSIIVGVFLVLSYIVLLGLSGFVSTRYYINCILQKDGDDDDE